MAHAVTATIFRKKFGEYPVAKVFATTDSVPDLAELETPAYSAAFDADPMVRRHAACDECRKRKLKCSGEPSGCERCLKHQLICHYSAQKQMGRPRKRRKVNDTPGHLNNTSIEATGNYIPAIHQSALPVQPPLPTLQPLQTTVGQVDAELPALTIETANFEDICSAPISQAIKHSHIQARAQTHPRSPPCRDSGSDSATRDSDSTLLYDGLATAPVDGLAAGMATATTSYNTDVSQWPDFSDMTMLPMLVQDNHRKENRSPQSPANFFPGTDGNDTFYMGAGAVIDLDADPNSLAQLPAIPDCPCLPNLYLTLSTLSTLSAFPVSSGTIDTLLGAHRTGRGAVYCEVCPQKFQSGSQNVMLCGMLITILADQWQRVRKATAADLKSGFGTSTDGEGFLRPTRPTPGPDGEADSSTSAHTSWTPRSMSIEEDLEWRTFGYRLVRAHVFGDAPVPTPPGSPVPAKPTTPRPSYTLNDLCSALERRQRQWHGLEPGSDEFPARMTGDLSEGHTAGMTQIELKRCEDETLANGDEHLCLRIVGHAKTVMRSLDVSPPLLET
ncbi:hypothetical protein A1O1_05801 [Capronia coronata CBS 617.96]|uniref:Zn(2)-C6 fungal-type domain-containing protein n=1 Tax=Capronia coronata CBS 617.96 TaxID=1182541 RepID=W9XY37_9EURO|nr:uncharacterized protein A1O1_05801 [Capronia coronata CBS 617.96]EXJ85437.1 hypothetical protein A1O1_05801 [Capronia coronata CBS 617.96]